MNKPTKASFASENFSGVHPEIMQALIAANVQQVPSYGNDAFTRDAQAVFKEQFGELADVYFTFNGTGANVFGLSCLTERHQAIYCSDVAHIYVDESTAPEAFTDCRLYPVTAPAGKIDIADLGDKLKRVGDIHHPQPGVVSITQPTEYGTVYTIAELRAIKALCVANNMLLHVDGARFFNAAIHLDVSLMQLSTEVGVDVLTLGGTKIGMMFGEAVIFFNQPSGAPLKFLLKRSMQLASKNRFIAVQFLKLFQDDLWKKLAAYTNRLAKQFEREIAGASQIKIAYPVETNAVFLRMPRSLHQQMQEFASFYYWNEKREEARLVFSFDNTPEEVSSLVQKLLSI